jgi:hypothetical protein
MAERDDAAIAAYVETTAQLLRLPIAPEHRAGVEANFARLAEVAELFIDAPLELHDEPAPVFRPGSSP